MMSDASSELGKSAGRSGEMIQIAFVVLKLIGEIEWSWWWVLAPAWISLALAVVIAVLVGFATAKL